MSLWAAQSERKARTHTQTSFTLFFGSFTEEAEFCPNGTKALGRKGGEQGRLPYNHSMTNIGMQCNIRERDILWCHFHDEFLMETSVKQAEIPAMLRPGRALSRKAQCRLHF